MNNLLTVEEIKIALDKNIIELGETSDGPVGFVVNGLVLSDEFDASDKEDALSIDAIWYDEYSTDYDEDFDDDDYPMCDSELTVDQIAEKYDNAKLAEMIHESLTTLAFGEDEITEFVRKAIS